MTHTLKSFLDGFVGTPREEVTRRLVFADWLDEQDDPVLNHWGEFIRLQIQTAEMELDDPARVPLMAREKELWKQNRAAWGQRFLDTLDMQNVHILSRKPCAFNPAWITYDRGVPDLAYRLDIGNNYFEISNIGFLHNLIKSMLDQRQPTHDPLFTYEQSIHLDDPSTVKAIISTDSVQTTQGLAEIVKRASSYAIVRKDQTDKLLEAVRFALDYGPAPTAVIPPGKNYGGYDTLGVVMELARRRYADVVNEQYGAHDAPVHVPHPRVLQMLMQAGCRPVFESHRDAPGDSLQYMLDNSRAEMDSDTAYWPKPNLVMIRELAQNLREQQR